MYNPYGEEETSLAMNVAVTPEPKKLLGERTEIRNGEKVLIRTWYDYQLGKEEEEVIPLGPTLPQVPQKEQKESIRQIFLRRYRRWSSRVPRLLSPSMPTLRIRELRIPTLPILRFGPNWSTKIVREKLRRVLRWSK